MTQNVDRLYKLLPSIYRQRDAEQGFPLQALLRVIAEQVNIVEDDIAQLYENWFIETCQDWVVPYIGDLVGYQVVHDAGDPSDVMTSEGQSRNKILIPRSAVANTIHDRRRKGTLRLLEELAKEIASWPAHAVEFYKQIGRTESINALQLRHTVDLRDGDVLDLMEGPFGAFAHTVDVHSPISLRTPGRYNIPSVGLFIWRLKVYSVTGTRARMLDEDSTEIFSFSILGNNTQLYTKAEPQAPTQQYSDELNFPTPIGRRQLKKRLTDYYGEDKSLFIWTSQREQLPAVQPLPQATRQHKGKHGRKRHSGKGAPLAPFAWEPVDPERIVVADLTDWQYRPTGSKVAVDPVLGRLAFAPDHEPEGGVKVLYHYAFSADIGGGEYSRPLAQPSTYELFRVSKQGEGDYRSIEEALEDWQRWKGQMTDASDRPFNAVIEIVDSAVYTEDRLRISLDEDEHLQIRAANRKRPVIHLLARQLDRTDFLDIAGAVPVMGQAGSRLTLDGLLIFGRGVHVVGELTQVTIRHCTLVPGWGLEHDCTPIAEHEASLILTNTNALVVIEHSILGPIVVNQDEVQQNPIQVQISDSILDAITNDHDALDASRGRKADVLLTIVRCTVFGQIQVRSINLAENTIFAGLVRVARSQLGCMRFCYVPENSRTPQRYHCQPDLVQQAVRDDETIIGADKQAEIQRETDRVRPVFTDTRYGTPSYSQLAADCAQEIKGGTDDESEMGVFHDLFQPQRTANLRARLDEFTPAGAEAGIIYVN